MKRSVITSDFEKRHSVAPMHVSKYAHKKQKKVMLISQLNLIYCIIMYLLTIS